MRGIAYYPEQWSEHLIDEDLGRIVEMGADAIRIGEFAWHIIEPQEGVYNFHFFDKVIKKAKERGLKVLFGTPTATFPSWLSQREPSIHAMSISEKRRQFGGRRLYCYSSDVYRYYTKKMVSALVTHYKDEASIVGWQVDNEVGHEESDMCYCKQCEAGFHRFLKNKYKEIAALNIAYGTDFWSQAYSDFDQVPLPLPTITLHNPALMLDWYRFRSFTLNEYMQLQIETINKHKGSKQVITHNLYGGYFDVAFDQYALCQNLDVVSFDNYPVWGGMYEPLKPHKIAFSLDYMRSLKRKSFWVTEQLIGAQGHDVIGYTPKVAQASLWAKQAVLHGASSLFFFRYRTNTKGQEQLCQGILDTDNQYNAKYEEVKSFFKWHEQVQKDKVVALPAKVAIVYDYDNRWSWHHQRQSACFDYSKELHRMYHGFYSHGVNVDIVSSHVDWSHYKLVVFPIFQIVNQGQLARIERFVKKGGTVIFTYRSAIRDMQNNLFFGSRAPVGLNHVLGIEIESFESLGPDEIINIYKYSQLVGTGQVWRDNIIANKAHILYSYHVNNHDYAACTVNQFGKGLAYYIGSSLSENLLDEIVKQALVSTELAYIKKPENLEVIPCNSGYFLLNHSSQVTFWNEQKIEAYDVVYINEKLEVDNG